MEILPVLISFSGGRTSAFMTRILVDYLQNQEQVIVFANTGKEREETLDFVHECDQRWNLGIVWVEAVINPERGKGTRHRIVDYKTASRNGEPFEEMIQKYGIPNLAYPHCSRELKRAPMESYCRSLGYTKWNRAIGIRADEQNRMSGEKYMTYPLVEWAIDKRAVSDWWKNQDFDLGLQEHEGNCDFCWKKSIKKLVKLTNERPSGLDWWEQMEKKYSTIQLEGRQSLVEPSFFFRGNRSSQDLRDLAVMASAQTSLFDSLPDEETDCFCKSN